jgi:hypothetical protein
MGCICYLIDRDYSAILDLMYYLVLNVIRTFACMCCLWRSSRRRAHKTIRGVVPCAARGVV